MRHSEVILITSSSSSRAFVAASYARASCLKENPIGAFHPRPSTYASHKTALYRLLIFFNMVSKRQAMEEINRGHEAVKSKKHSSVSRINPRFPRCSTEMGHTKLKSDSMSGCLEKSNSLCRQCACVTRQVVYHRRYRAGERGSSKIKPHHHED